MKIWPWCQFSYLRNNFFIRQFTQKFVVIDQCELNLQDNYDKPSKMTCKRTGFCTNPTSSHKTSTVTYLCGLISLNLLQLTNVLNLIRNVKVSSITYLWCSLLKLWAPVILQFLGPQLSICLTRAQRTFPFSSAPHCHHESQKCYRN